MNFKINFRPLFTIIIKAKNVNFKTRDFSRCTYRMSPSWFEANTTYLTKYATKYVVLITNYFFLLLSKYIRTEQVSKEGSSIIPSTEQKYMVKYLVKLIQYAYTILLPMYLLSYLQPAYKHYFEVLSFM